MGWKPGQGVGSRLTKREKHRIKQRNERLRLAQENHETVPSNSEDSDDDSVDVTFAPDDYEPFRCKPKDNYFGIGYSGLDRRKVLSGHVNLFDAPAFCVQDKNKKLSIRGQAFGVGAFEADDEDIYEREDKSRYDFALGPEPKTKTRWSQDGPSGSQTDRLEGFVRAKERLEGKKVFKPPELPKDFAPVHAVRKSRFYPPIAAPSHTLENGKRRELNAADRARILEDPDDRSKKPSSAPVAANIISKTLNLHGKQQTEERRKLEAQRTAAATTTTTAGSSWLDKLSTKSFVKGGAVGSAEHDAGSLMKLEDFRESIASTSSSADKPSEDDAPDTSRTRKLLFPEPDKQRRFEQYLAFLKDNEPNKLESVQPLSMAEWDREQERTEFEQAAKLEQPNDCTTDKFVQPVSRKVDDDPDTDPDKEKKQAVRLKMFGKLTRERCEWKPAGVVCKRFNIPEPKVGCAQVATGRKTARFSVFDSLDWCGSSKFTRATDTVSEAPGETPAARAPRRTEGANEAAAPAADLNSIPSNVYQPSEPVSEKFKIFEASYEKVFGKGIQSDSSTTSTDVERAHAADGSMSEDAPTNREAEDEGEVAAVPANTFKNVQSEEKKDLFKAIFLSSSSEDSDSDEAEGNIDSEAVKSVLIGKDPRELNAQRNTSPPRGIFAKLDLDSLVAPPKGLADKDRQGSDGNREASKAGPLADPNAADEAVATEVAISPDVYGPVLPQRLLKQESGAAEVEREGAEVGADNAARLPVFRSVVVSKSTSDSSKLTGEWVERRGKAKKEKKERKKHKHKEHKSSRHKKRSKRQKRSRR